MGWTRLVALMHRLILRTHEQCSWQWYTYSQQPHHRLLLRCWLWNDSDPPHPLTCQWAGLSRRSLCILASRGGAMDRSVCVLQLL